MKTLVKFALACVLAVSFSIGQNAQAVPDPLVTNTNFSVTSGKTVATIVGSCISTQNLGMTVNVYWGLTDYGSTTASWSHTNSIGALTSGQSFATVLSPLVPGNTYYWNCVAVDSLTNTSYLATSGSFTTAGIVGVAAGSLLTNATMSTTLTVGGTRYATQYGTVTPAVNATVAATTAVSITAPTATWTPAYRTINLLDENTNSVTLVLCTNMPPVTACTNALPNTVYGFGASTAAVVTNAQGTTKGVLQLTP